MEVSKVTKSDLVNCQQLFNILKECEMPRLKGQDALAVADTLRWVSDFLKEVGSTFQKENPAPKKESSPAVPPSAVPAGSPSPKTQPLKPSSKKKSLNKRKK